MQPILISTVIRLSDASHGAVGGGGADDGVKSDDSMCSPS